MNKKKYSVVLLLCFSHSLIHSQIKIKPEICWNSASMSIENNNNLQNTNYNIAFKGGIKLGVYANISLFKKFSLEPGLFFSQKGYLIDIRDNIDNNLSENSTLRMNTIEIPVHINYDISLKKAGSMFLFIGPYIGYAINGKYQLEGNGYKETTQLAIGTTRTDNIKPLDFGMNAGLGYTTPYNIYLRMQAGIGCINIATKYNAQKMYNNVFGFSVGYIF